MSQVLDILKENTYLNRFAWAVKRHYTVIFAGLIVGLCLGFAVISYLTPKYKASSEVLFDPTAEIVISPEPNNLLPSILNLKALERAIALIQSTGTLKQVASKLTSSPADILSFSPRTSIQKILQDNSLDDDARVRRLILRLQQGLSVKTEASDQVIIVDYQSEGPREAAYLTNLIIETFIEDRAATRKNAIAQATEWLDKRTAEARDKLIAADKAIRDYKADRHIDTDTGSTAYDTQLLRLRDQLSAIQGRIADAETMEKALKAYDSGERSDYEKLTGSANDQTISRLRTSLADAEAEVVATQTKLGINHPEVRAKQGRVQVIKQEIETEARRRLQTGEKELEGLRNQHKEIKASIEAAEAKLHDVRGSEGQLREMQREREAVKSLYDATLTRLTQAAAQQTRALSEFKVLMDAAIPERPKINPLLIVAGGGLLGLLLGTAACFLLDNLNDQLVHLDDIEHRLPINLIARVPTISREDFVHGVNGANGVNGSQAVNGNLSPARYLHFAKEFPQSLFTNSLLNALLALTETGGAEGGKIIMITSPMQGEGKTHLSANLASLSALLGEKTLLINLDSRKEVVQEESTIEAVNPNIAAMLDRAQLSEHLTAAHSAGNFDFIMPSLSEGMVWLKLFQPQMRELLQFARKNYDQVWIDTPPVQIFADALILARHVDSVIIVSEWSRTTGKQLKDTRDLILRSGGKVIGVIVNKIKVDRLISQSMAYYRSYYADEKKRKAFT